MGKDYDNRFDGKRVYEYMMATQAKYEIRGNKLYEYMMASSPVFDI